MASYVGIIDGSGDVWGVRVPDLPGVYGGGASPEEAVADAASASREWIAHHKAKGIAIPMPRASQDILAEVEDGERAVEIQVEAIPRE